MKFGFIIDNRKCIGCHACTTACKSEHDVPIGVNRTWVKQTEKGEFPNSKRVFSVLRCNHCTDAPCVEICPTQALFTRKDGIVDFNNDRCIGCKSCMQACPYDALYIDPDTHTAAKCNYCAHRVDIGLEPACVNVCPEHAIISGDMDDPNSEIAQLLAREQVTVRKPEKYTGPNVFYINGDSASLTPSETDRQDQYIWGSQNKGVGHYARFLEKTTDRKTFEDMVNELSPSSREMSFPPINPKRSVEVLMEKAKAKRVYDTPDKGILWGWEVAGYVLTKAISSGVILLLVMADLLGVKGVTQEVEYTTVFISLFFLLLTGILLVKDLDQPKRFLYVLLRPHWNSWLVRGGYSITFFGLFVSVWLFGLYFNIESVVLVARWLSVLAGLMVAVYTAFLFAQAKGRDFWQSPMLVLHMLVHSLMAGSAFFVLIGLVVAFSPSMNGFILLILKISTVVNVILIGIELSVPHATHDSKSVVEMILKGNYSKLFWIGAMLLGNIIPVLILFVNPQWAFTSALFVLSGIYVTEKIWIEAPQRISLT
ncbi:MAG: polysulfide reductase NrfD [Flammeovirgaceae bacterium]|nr:polysulfide reductase NrfD [Flammeovirgaceae bacterium]